MLERYENMARIKRIEVTLDITLYCIIYICFLSTVFPILVSLLQESGMELPVPAMIFLDICFFCKKYHYIPVVVFLGIIAWSERYTKIFHSWLVRFGLKCIVALFFICAMLFLSLPLWSLL